MKINDITRQSLLYDFYGALLTERQRDVMRLYHEENLSLAEIADEFGISRQGVHDALHKAEKLLEGYENKLGLVDRFGETSEAIRQIDAQIEALILQVRGAEPGNKTEASLADELEEIRKVIDKLEA